MRRNNSVLYLLDGKRSIELLQFRRSPLAKVLVLPFLIISIEIMLANLFVIFADRLIQLAVQLELRRLIIGIYQL